MSYNGRRRRHQMVKTIYTCDKCGKTVDHPKEQMWTLGVVVREGFHGSFYDCKPGETDIQVCRPCLELLGIHRSPDIKPGGIALPPPPSLEDLIREIVRGEVENA